MICGTIFLILHFPFFVCFHAKRNSTAALIMIIENDHKNVGVPQKLHRTTGTFRGIGENAQILWHVTLLTERGYRGERGRNGQTVLGQIVGNMEQGKDIDYAKDFIGTNQSTIVCKMNRPNTRAILV